MAQFPIRRVVVATHNTGKLREIGEILAPFSLELVSAAEMGVPEPEETGQSFAENATLKAVHAAAATGLWALADDSGLAVEGLDGAPGIYSARWGGPAKDFAMASRRVADELRAAGHQPEGAPAAFLCVLALASPDGECHAFEGRIDGHLTFPPRGEHGFGYDPIFVADGMKRSFAELSPAEKHEHSHRARAFAKLAAWMRPAWTPSA